MPRLRFRNFPFRGLAVRLALHGCTNRPFYHMVVIPTHKGRDSTPLEQIGTFDPMINEHNERLVAVNFDRYKYWVARGAIPTKPVLELLGRYGSARVSESVYQIFASTLHCCLIFYFFYYS